MEKQILEVKLKSAETKKAILDMGLEGGGGHIAPGLSCTDLLSCVYYGDLMNFDPNNEYMLERDRFILSKGHGVMPLYAILADLGYFDKEHLKTFTKAGSILGCHADRTLVPGLEATTGSLGLGIGVAVGMAQSAILDKSDRKVYALLGDGECQEGIVWESITYAGTNGFDNLTIMIDNNQYGATSRLKDNTEGRTLGKKMEAFGWSVRDIDGHEVREILPALKEAPYEKGKPTAIIANTQKGKGITHIEKAYAEGNPVWHYRIPKDAPEIAESYRDLDKGIELARKELDDYLAKEDQ